MREMTKMRIEFDEPDTNLCGETLWVTPLKNGNYRLENQPLSVDLNLHDVVKAEIKDDILTFKSLVISRANSISN